MSIRPDSLCLAEHAEALHEAALDAFVVILETSRERLEHRLQALLAPMGPDCNPEFIQETIRQLPVKLQRFVYHKVWEILSKMNQHPIELQGRHVAA